jgi:prepilin-type N-terminal cleavage/methylation domain-containing protein
VKKLRNSKGGVTLVELVIVIGILAVVISAAFSVLLSGTKTYNLNTTNAVSQAGLRAAMMQISKQERKADTVTPGASSLTFTISGNSVSYTVSGNQLFYGSALITGNIKTISSSVSGKVLTVTLTALDNNTLTTQMHTN